MADLNRRSFLFGVSSTLIAIPVAKGFACVPIMPKQPLPVFAVGIPERPSWELISADSLDAAIEHWLADAGIGECCEMVEMGEPACADNQDVHTSCCDFCSSTMNVAGYEAKKLFGKTTFSDADLLSAGIYPLCSRCREETFEYLEVYIVGDEAVCAECMTIEDRKIVNPKHAEELAEAANG